MCRYNLSSDQSSYLVAMRIIIMLHAALSITVYIALGPETSSEKTPSIYLLMGIVGLILEFYTGLGIYEACLHLGDINVATPGDEDPEDPEDPEEPGDTTSVLYSPR